MNTPELLTPREVAERLRVSNWTVYDLFRKGELRGVRVGKAVRVFADSVAAFIDAHTNAAPVVKPLPVPFVPPPPRPRNVRKGGWEGYAMLPGVQKMLREGRLGVNPADDSP